MAAHGRGQTYATDEHRGILLQGKGGETAGRHAKVQYGFREAIRAGVPKNARFLVKLLGDLDHHLEEVGLIFRCWIIGTFALLFEVRLCLGVLPSLVVEAIVSVGIRGAVMTGDACLLLKLTKPLVDGQAL